MKRFLHIITALLVLGMLLPSLTAAGQGRIETKKYKLQDLQAKITKVVMTGNPFRDGALRQDVVARWHISPFEFCTLEEYEKLKGSTDYYFLVPLTGQFAGEIEPGIDFLTFLKGGAENADGVGERFEVVSVPFGTPGGTGREIAMLPALLDIIQDFALKAQERDIKGYQGLSLYNKNFSRIKGRNILLAEGDLSIRVTPLDREGLEGHIVPDDEADNAMIEGRPGTVVSYTVAPENPSSASRCYKMLLDTESHELYYFKRQHISGKTGTGFGPNEIHRISSTQR